MLSTPSCIVFVIVIGRHTRAWSWSSSPWFVMVHVITVVVMVEDHRGRHGRHGRGGGGGVHHPLLR